MRPAGFMLSGGVQICLKPTYAKKVTCHQLNTCSLRLNSLRFSTLSQHLNHSGKRCCHQKARRKAPAAAKQDGRDDDQVDLPEPPEIDFGVAPEVSAAPDKVLQLPRDVVERIKTTVLGFDVFSVTAVENYEMDGVLFRGTLRGGSPAVSHDKMSARLKEQLGEDYRIFLLQDKQEAPVAVVLPKLAVEDSSEDILETVVAIVFGLATAGTSLVAFGLPLFDVEAMGELVGAEGLPAAIQGSASIGLLFFATLLAHEAGHFLAARRQGLKLRIPTLVPAGIGLLGSFGAITRIKSMVPNRQALLEIAAAGPAVGTAASLALALVGLLLTALGSGSAPVGVDYFEDSLLMGSLGMVFLGDQLAYNDVVELHPLLLAGWAGLVVNALNVIPVGELDGGRIAHSLWGRRAAERIRPVVLLLLGLGGIIDSLSLLWLALIVFLQSNPITPQLEELSAPSNQRLTRVSIGLLFLPLLMLLPFPFGIGPE